MRARSGWRYLLAIESTLSQPKGDAAKVFA